MSDFNSTVRNLLSTPLTTDDHCLLCDSTIQLRKAPKDPQFNIQSDTVILLWTFFADSNRNALSRRWVGVFLLSLITTFDTLRETFREGPEILTHAIGNVITRPESDELKVIAGSIIRKLHKHGFALNSFWSNDVAREATESFSQSQDTQWFDDFYRFLERIEEFGKAKDSDSEVLIAINIIIDKQLDTDAGGVLIEVQSGMLTLAVLPLAQGPFFLDVPVSSIENTRIKRINATSQTDPAQGIELYLKSDTWNCIANGKMQRSELVSIILQSEDDAKYLASVIKRVKTNISSAGREEFHFPPIVPSSELIDRQSAVKPQSSLSKSSITNLELSTVKANGRRLDDLKLDGTPPRKLRDRLRDEKGEEPSFTIETPQSQGHAIREQRKQQLEKSQGSEKVLAETSSKSNALPISKKARDAAKKKGALSGDEDDENAWQAAETTDALEIFDIHDTDNSPRSKKVPAKTSRKAKCAIKKKRGAGRKNRKVPQADYDSDTYMPNGNTTKAKKKSRRETRASTAKQKRISASARPPAEEETDVQEAEDVGAPQHNELDEVLLVNNQPRETAATFSPPGAPVKAHPKTTVHSTRTVSSAHSGASGVNTLESQSHSYTGSPEVSKKSHVVHHAELLIDQAIKIPSLIQFGKSGPVNQGMVSKEAYVQASQYHDNDIRNSSNLENQLLNPDSTIQSHRYNTNKELHVNELDRNTTPTVPLMHSKALTMPEVAAESTSQKQHHMDQSVMTGAVQAWEERQASPQAGNDTVIYKNESGPMPSQVNSADHEAAQMVQETKGAHFSLPATDTGFLNGSSLEFDEQPLIDRPAPKSNQETAIVSQLISKGNVASTAEDYPVQRQVIALQLPVQNEQSYATGKIRAAQPPQICPNFDPEQVHRKLSSNRDQPHMNAQITSKRPITESPPTTPRVKRSKELHPLQNHDDKRGAEVAGFSKHNLIVGGEEPTGSQLSYRVDSHGSPYSKETRLQLDPYTTERVSNTRHGDGDLLISVSPTAGASVQPLQAPRLSRSKPRSESNAVSYQHIEKPYYVRGNVNLALGASANQRASTGYAKSLATTHHVALPKQTAPPVPRTTVRIINKLVEIVEEVEKPVSKAVPATDEEELPMEGTRFQQMLRFRARSICSTGVTDRSQAPVSSWGDAEKTLIGEAPNRNSDPMEVDQGENPGEQEQEVEAALEEEPYSSGSDVSKTTNAEDTAQSSEESQQIAVEEEGAWEDMLLPHQRTYAEAVSRINEHLLRHVVDCETAITSVVTDYETNGLKLIDAMATVHQEDRNKCVETLEEIQRVLAVELKEQCKALERGQKEMKTVVSEAANVEAVGRRGYDGRIKEIEGLLARYG